MLFTEIKDKIFAVYAHESLKGLDTEYNRNAYLFGGIEIRLDFLTDPYSILTFDFSNILQRVILTYRQNFRGGKGIFTDSELLQYLEKIDLLEPSYLDVDLGFYRSQLELKSLHTPLIISAHNFQTTPDSKEIISAFHGIEHVVKFAYKVNSSHDLFSIDNAFKELIRRKEVIAIGMGEQGVQTRIVYPLVGSFGTFAPFFEPNAPGQISLNTLNEIYLSILGE